MAVFLGGMVLIGIEPGPSMVTSELNVTYSIIWSLAIANVLGAGLCILLASPIARLTTIPFPLLAPFMITVVCFAAFQATRDIADLVALLAIGVLGVLMKRFAWPRPALLIGYVLAPQAETYFYQALQFYGWGFLQRPGVVIIGVLTLISIWFGIRNRVDDSQPLAARADGGVEQGRRPVLADRAPQIAFTMLVLAMFGIAIWDAAGHSFLGQVFPMSTAAVAAFFGLLLLWVLILGENTNPAVYDNEADTAQAADPSVGNLWNGAYWIAALVGASALVGFYLAMILFFLVFLTVRARTGPVMTLTLTAAAAGFILILANALSLNFPYGALQSAVDLPWPFR